MNMKPVDRLNQHLHCQVMTGYAIVSLWALFGLMVDYVNGDLMTSAGNGSAYYIYHLASKVISNIFNL